MARAVLPRPDKDGGTAMSAIEQLLVIMLLLAAAVVFAYFYVKRAQARTSAKATPPSEAQEPPVFRAPSSTEPPAPSRMGEAPAASPPAASPPAVPPPAEPSASARARRPRCASWPP